MTDNVKPITTARRQRHVGSIASEHPDVIDMRRDYEAAFTRIGNALGLTGQFLLHFGYEQIELAAKQSSCPTNERGERVITNRVLAECALIAGDRLRDEDGFEWWLAGADGRPRLHFDDGHQCSGVADGLFQSVSWRVYTRGPWVVVNGGVR